MIKNREKYQRFEAEIIRKSKVDIHKNFVLLNAMYEEAVALGIIPLRDPLSGIETDITIAKVVNSVSTAP
ncbi:MAG: hypothetical protein ACLFVG_06820 [Candidatus Aminicenantes bacterium]